MPLHRSGAGPVEPRTLSGRTGSEHAPELERPLKLSILTDVFEMRGVSWRAEAGPIGAEAMDGVPSVTHREFELLDADADHAKCTAFNLLVAVWRYHTHYEPFRRCLHWAGLLAERHPEGIGVLHVVEVSALPPEAPTRRLFTELLQLPAVRHYSVLHPARGFKAASVRGVITGSFAMARTRAAHSVHASLDEVSRWIAEQQRRLGRAESAESIARVIEGLRRLHAERFPATQPTP